MPAKIKATKSKKVQKKSAPSPVIASPSTSKTASTSAKVSKRAEKPSTSEDNDLELQNDDVPEESSDEGDDEDGVDEEGMEKLMKLLGEDGLDDFARAELEALAGENDEEEGSDEGEDSEDGGLGSEDEEGDVDVEAHSDEESVQEGDEAQNAQEEELEDIPLDEAESVDEDVVPRQKIEIDNKMALERIRDTIKLDSSMLWTETLTVSYPEIIEVDVNDDLNRELAFYKQALHGAQTAKALAAKHDFPFTRPSDYFAEMVKSDAHMERIRQRLLDEGATIKRSEEKRKEREGKKFGKQVQMEKLKERERSKKDMEERLKGLKRKRKDGLDNTQEQDDGFDIAVEDAIADRPSKRSRGGDAGGRGGKRGLSRDARDGKFGFGGPGRRAKQNTKSSTDDFEPRGDRTARGGRDGSRGGGARGGARGGGGRGGARGGGRGGARGGGTGRLGKSRRMATRGRS